MVILEPYRSLFCWQNICLQYASSHTKTDSAMVCSGSLTLTAGNREVDGASLANRVIMPLVWVHKIFIHMKD